MLCPAVLEGLWQTSYLLRIAKARVRNELREKILKIISAGCRNNAFLETYWRYRVTWMLSSIPLPLLSLCG